MFSKYFLSYVAEFLVIDDRYRSIAATLTDANLV